MKKKLHNILVEISHNFLPFTSQSKTWTMFALSYIDVFDEIHSQVCLKYDDKHNRLKFGKFSYVDSQFKIISQESTILLSFYFPLLLKSLHQHKTLGLQT